MTSTPTQDRAARRAAKKSNPDRLSAWTTFTWSTTGVSAAINAVVVGYFVFYGTDVLGIPAALLGTIAVASKVLEAVVVIPAGWLVDRSRETRWGKARPYELAIVGVWLATWVLFSVPDLDVTGKAIWLFVALLFVNVVFTTLLGANDVLYTARTFNSRLLITKVSTRTGFFIVLAVVAFNVVLPILIAQAGTSPSAWSTMILFIAIPMATVGLGRLVFNKEKYETEAPDEPKVTFRDIREVLSKNKYVWIVGGITFLAYTAGGTGLTVYYFRYIVGDIALMGVTAALPIVILPTMLLYPWLMRKVGVSRIIGYSAALGVLGGLVWLLANGNLILVVVATLLGGLAVLPITFLAGLLVIDNANFNQWSGRRRLESTMGAINSFGLRLAAGLSLGIAGWVLGLSGYDGSLEVQPDSALMAIVGLMGALPIVLWLIVILLVRPYRKLELMLPTITQELAMVLAADPKVDARAVEKPDALDVTAVKRVHAEIVRNEKENS